MSAYLANNLMIASPISGMPSRIIERLSVQKIKDSYYKALNVDVSDYFEGIDELLICECNQTNYRFYYPSIVGKPSFYNALDEFDWYYPKWKWENELSLKYFNKDAAIIDIGCGSGNFLFDLNKKGYSNLSGIDTGNLDEINFKKNGITFFNGNIEDFALHNSSTFDVVTCFQILEHIIDINSFITSCLKLLKKDGKLIIAVPNNNPFLFKHDIYHTLNLPPHHVGLWCKKSLKNISSLFDVNLLSLKTQPIADQIGYYTIVQKEYLENNYSSIKFLFKSRLINKIYNKILYMRRHKIEGHTVMAIYQKNSI